MRAVGPRGHCGSPAPVSHSPAPPRSPGPLFPLISSTIAGDDGALRGQNSIFSDVYTDAVTEAEGDSDEGARAALLRLSLRG